jgi:hypothetical protein
MAPFLKIDPHDSTELAEEQEEAPPTPVDVDSPLIARATAIQAGGGFEPLASHGEGPCRASSGRGPSGPSRLPI